MLDLNNYETADMVQKGHTIILPLSVSTFRSFYYQGASTLRFLGKEFRQMVLCICTHLKIRSTAESLKARISESVTR